MKPQQAKAHVLSSEELRRLQRVLLDMLLEVDRVCQKNGVKYSLSGGTFLGAVRHKGFIPWDDDLDIMVIGEEYKRFREACIRDLDPEKYFFQDHTTDPHYRWGYGKIRRKDSEFLRLGQEHMKMQTGIFIDVFHRSGVPDRFPRRQLHCFTCFFIRKALYSEVGKYREKNPLMRGWYRLLNRIPSQRLFRKLDRLEDQWNKKPTQLVRAYTFPPPKGQYGYSLEAYKKLSSLEFEGHTFPVVADWHAYMTYKFGDYMTLPPPEQRHWHPVSTFRLPKGY